jgi:hypothetical protein
MKVNRRIRKAPNSYSERRYRRSKDWIRNWFFKSDHLFNNFERLNPEE